MANVVYVGNYPNTLSEDEVLEIFKDFEGVVLLRSIKKDRKCYSFILCQDQEQVIEVVFVLNGLDVGGRNLIVRASDDELQEIIDQCEYEEECANYESYADNDEGYPTTSLSPSGASYCQPRKPSCLAQEDYESGNDQSHMTSYASLCENKHSSSKVNYRQPRKSSRLAHVGETRDFLSKGNKNQTDSEEGAYGGAFREGDEADESASCYSYSTSKNGSISPCSMASSFNQRRHRGEKFSFVSIVNFPDETSVEELQEMFADYNPFKIIIQKRISDEENPTEATVCFLRSNDATSSILNLDNTIYKGKVIIVTERDDVSLITDLMKVHHC